MNGQKRLECDFKEMLKNEFPRRHFCIFQKQRIQKHQPVYYIKNAIPQ